MNNNEPLYWVAKNGYADIFELLLYNGAKINPNIYTNATDEIRKLINSIPSYNTILMNTKQNPFNQLPDELLNNIAKYLPAKEIKRRS